MDFSIRLRLLRHKYKLTQGELAAILGVKSTAISNYESKRNEPSYEKLIALCDYFKVSCDYLLGISDTNLRMDNEDIDFEIIQLYHMYHHLSEENKKEISKYLSYLLYRQGDTENDKDLIHICNKNIDQKNDLNED
jgi:transcriptional regulator with XRE-family HTH domain